MRRTLACLLVLGSVACGSAPAGAPLTIPALKFKVIDAIGSPAFCDPDFYPIARLGGEEANASAMYSQIRADAELYSAIVAHEHLPPPPAELDDAQKLTLYRAFKKLRVVELKPSDTGYTFDYIVDGTFMHVQGTVSSDGTVSIGSKTQGGRPNCPICLSASTLIGTPSGDIVVTSIRAGTLVWTRDAGDRRVAMPVIKVGSTPVPATHLMVHLTLADGRELWASPGHRTADGASLGSLAVGDIVNGSRVVGWELVPYSSGRTYDLLPAGPTRTYWANGILLESTLNF